MIEELVRKTWYVMLLGVMLASGCGSGDVQESGGKLRVVVTTGMIRDVVENLGGDYVELEGLIGTGVDPHLYKPTVSDVKKLQAADLVIYNGLKLEGKMGDILAKLKEKGTEVVAISESLKNREGYLLDGDAGYKDPHIWMDVQGWISATEECSKALIRLLPENKDSLEKQLGAYLAQLSALDSYVKTSIESIPESQRILVTAHDAFNYMSRAYGIEVRGIQGMSTESEAGVREIEELVSFLVEKKIPAVFVESSVSDKNVKALIEGAAAKGWDVSIGGELFSDAMGKEGTYRGTYIGMMDHNATTISNALGGKVDETGFSGKLKSNTH